MIKKAVAPHISENSAQFIAETFPNLNAGCSYILDVWPIFYKRTLADLKGIFSENELMLMIDVSHPTALTAQLAGQHLYIQVVNGCELDHLDEKWKIDKLTILKKIKALPIYSLACLEIWANGFWHANEEFRAEKDLSVKNFKEWAKQLL